MNKYSSILIFCMLSVQLFAQPGGRIESEYKLAVPNRMQERIWLSISTQPEAFLPNQFIDSLTTVTSREKFVDRYFDTPDRVLISNQSGVRLRERYINDVLEKKLIQIKLPLDSSGIARTEHKFEVDEPKSARNLNMRHPFLQHIRNSDEELVNYHLADMFIRADHLSPVLNLLQYRDRLYISDTIGSLATITLDRVHLMKFPFHHFTEMEIELNEIRYTEADSLTRLKLDSFRILTKNNIINAFPELYVDQTPKYNKMYDTIQTSLWKPVTENFMWLIFSGILIFAAILKVLEWK